MTFLGGKNGGINKLLYCKYDLSFFIIIILMAQEMDSLKYNGKQLRNLSLNLSSFTHFHLIPNP